MRLLKPDPSEHEASETRAAINNETPETRAPLKEAHETRAPIKETPETRAVKKKRHLNQQPLKNEVSEIRDAEK